MSTETHEFIPENIDFSQLDDKTIAVVSNVENDQISASNSKGMGYVLGEIFGVPSADAAPAIVIPATGVGSELLAGATALFAAVKISDEMNNNNDNSDSKKSNPPLTYPLHPSKVTKDDNELGVCKKSYPYSPADKIINEYWMKKNNISQANKIKLSGTLLYGMNPGNFTTSEKKGVTKIKVNTELPGGDMAARECFKNLTGNYPKPFKDEYHDKDKGTFINYRDKNNSSTGHPKVDINVKKTHEKITFK